MDSPNKALQYAEKQHVYNVFTNYYLFSVVVPYQQLVECWQSFKIRLQIRVNFNVEFIYNTIVKFQYFNSFHNSCFSFYLYFQHNFLLNYEILFFQKICKESPNSPKTKWLARVPRNGNKSNRSSARVKQYLVDPRRANDGAEDKRLGTAVVINLEDELHRRRWGRKGEIFTDGCRHRCQLDVCDVLRWVNFVTLNKLIYFFVVHKYSQFLKLQFFNLCTENFKTRYNLFDN